MFPKNILSLISLFLFTSLFKYSKISFFLFGGVCFFPTLGFSASSSVSSSTYSLSSTSGSLSLSSSYFYPFMFFGMFLPKVFPSLSKYSYCCCFWYCWYLCFIFSMYYFSSVFCFITLS